MENTQGTEMASTVVESIEKRYKALCELFPPRTNQETEENFTCSLEEAFTILEEAVKVKPDLKSQLSQIERGIDPFDSGNEERMTAVGFMPFTLEHVQGGNNDEQSARHNELRSFASNLRAEYEALKDRASGKSTSASAPKDGSLAPFSDQSEEFNPLGLPSNVEATFNLSDFFNADDLVVGPEVPAGNQSPKSFQDSEYPEQIAYDLEMTEDCTLLADGLTLSGTASAFGGSQGGLDSDVKDERDPDMTKFTEDFFK